MAKEYIEREAAKRELLSWAVCMNHPEYLMKDDALHVIDSIPAADVVEQEQESKPLNGWISVQDRLPEHGDVVLCFMKFGGQRLLLWDGVSSWWLGYGSGDDWQKADVTHWQYLPQPPKGE